MGDDPDDIKLIKQYINIAFSAFKWNEVISGVQKANEAGYEDDGKYALMKGIAYFEMDLIKQAGGEPANFLDVGGTADASRVKSAFQIILQDSSVKAILINIFGGIVRCDRVARGIVDAYNNMADDINVPIIVRLQGTNSELAKKIIDNSNLKVESAILFKEAAEKVQKALL